MKIRRDQFKVLIKECLQELIAEGNISLAGANLIPQQQHPHVKALAMQTKNPNMMEKIFADTANNSLPEHLSSEPMAMGNFQQGMQQDMNNYGMQQNGYVHVPQLNNIQQQQQYYPQQQQQMMQQQQPNNSVSASPWARLAFNSPIRNRPGAEGGMSSVFGGSSANFLPGQNTGKFG